MENYSEETLEKIRNYFTKNGVEFDEDRNLMDMIHEVVENQMKDK